MKRSRGLLLGLLALIVLAGVFALITLVDFEKTEAEPEATPAPVAALAKDDIATMTYTYEGNTLSFRQRSGGWVYREDVTFPIRQAELNAMAKALEAVQASRTIDGVGDRLADFGLEEPQVKIVIGFEDKSEKTYLIGDMNAATTEYYFMVAGEEAVHTVSAEVASPFMRGLYALTTLEAMPEFEAKDINAIQYTAGEEQFSLSYTQQDGENNWYVQGRKADYNNAAELLQAAAAITPTANVCYLPDEAALAEMGLDTPRAVLKINYTHTYEVEVEPEETLDPEAEATPEPVYETVTEKLSCTVELGAETEEGVYLRIDGSDMICLAEAESVQVLLDATAQWLTETTAA